MQEFVLHYWGNLAQPCWKKMHFDDFTSINEQIFNNDYYSSKHKRDICQLQIQSWYDAFQLTENLTSRHWDVSTLATSLPSLVWDCTGISELMCNSYSRVSSNKPNWTHLSLPHSSCNRWWSIGLLRYTHTPLILHRSTTQSHPLCHFSFLSLHYLNFFQFHSTWWCTRTLICFILHFLIVSLLFDIV